MESQPREAAPAEAVEATTKPCSPASRFPPVSPQLRNMDANQSQQYTYINTTLTAFYGNTIKTRNPDDSFTGPFGQLLYVFSRCNCSLVFLILSAEMSGFI
jgi:hypothetical protein